MLDWTLQWRNGGLARPRFCTVKAKLGRRQPGIMRWMLLWNMPLVQDRSLDIVYKQWKHVQRLWCSQSCRNSESEWTYNNKLPAAGGLSVKTNTGTMIALQGVIWESAMAVGACFSDLISISYAPKLLSVIRWKLHETKVIYKSPGCPIKKRVKTNPFHRIIAVPLVQHCFSLCGTLPYSYHTHTHTHTRTPSHTHTHCSEHCNLILLVVLLLSGWQ